ncbi:MAG: carboxypeptidase-like regulatory domain-containing protein [Ectopseudomonas guguanensis]|uniref:carboxypeptidase-like regulatory domain-containing protein n=1 Tax=Ectopseudomonas guguanensis TaxID=1198456 RepID=UPI003919AAAD
MLSAETGLAVAGARIELDIGSDEFWGDETVSDAEGRFAFAEQRDYRLIALLADAPRCWTRLSVSAPGYHTRRCGWISMHGCSSVPMKLPHLTLQPDYLADLEEEAPDNLWHCIESAMEKAN